jgi:hypothetical protein
MSVYLSQNLRQQLILFRCDLSATIDRQFRADISAPTVARTTISRAAHQRPKLTHRDLTLIFVLTCTHTSTSVTVQTLTFTVVVARTVTLVITCTLTLTLSLHVNVVRSCVTRENVVRATVGAEMSCHDSFSILYF